MYFSVITLFRLRPEWNLLFLCLYDLFLSNRMLFSEKCSTIIRRKWKWECENVTKILHNIENTQAVQTVSVFELMFRQWKMLQMMKNEIYLEGFVLTLSRSLSFFILLSSSYFPFSFVAAHAISTWFIDPARVGYICLSQYCSFFPIFSLSFSSKLWQNIIHADLYFPWEMRKQIAKHRVSWIVHMVDVRCCAFSVNTGCVVDKCWSFARFSPWQLTGFQFSRLNIKY